MLNGTTSSDPQGNVMSYQWSLVGPSGSMTILSSNSGPVVTFVPDKPGSYTVVLTVMAGSKSSVTSKTVSVTGVASGKAITSFGFANPQAVGTINESAKTISVTVPNGTNVTALVAIFTTTGASVKVNNVTQVSGTTAIDFTSPVSYLVTAGDSSTVTYTVTVTVASASGKQITSFGFANPQVTGVIDETNKVIFVTVPSGTNVTALAASFTTTGASVKVNNVTQVSGTTTNNFSSPVSYLVTASDSSTVSYTVTVTVVASSDPLIGNWQLSTVNGAAVSSIPMAMNLTVKSDATWTAIGGSTGNSMFAYGGWTKQSTGVYTVTFVFGGPEGVGSMYMLLSGTTLTATIVETQGTMTYVYIPGTAAIPDPIIGSWHLSSMNPMPDPPMSMNFTFNSNNTWSANIVQTGDASTASGNWNQTSPGKYLVTFLAGGPQGVPSMLFTLSQGTLSTTFTDQNQQRSMTLNPGSTSLPDPIVGNWKLDKINSQPASTIPLGENFVFSSDGTCTVDGATTGQVITGSGTWTSSGTGAYTLVAGAETLNLTLSNNRLSWTAIDPSHGTYTAELVPGVDTNLPDPVVGWWMLDTVDGITASNVPMAQNIQMNADHTWSTNGVMHGISINANGTWNPTTQNNYVANFVSGGPQGVPSFAFSMDTTAGTGTTTMNMGWGVQTFVYKPGGTTIAPDPIWGTWVLSSIDGTPASSIPASGTTWVNSDGTYTWSHTEHSSTMTGGGHWNEPSPNSYAFTETSTSVTDTAYLSNGNQTFTSYSSSDGRTYVYTKQ
jgi:hypothetical protein